MLLQIDNLIIIKNKTKEIIEEKNKQKCIRNKKNVMETKKKAKRKSK